MKKLYVAFLISLASCATKPKVLVFNADWKFCKLNGKKMVCLSVEDTKRLRELLIRGCAK